jgi:uncharacterized RDD family membrane protein YckC
MKTSPLRLLLGLALGWVATASISAQAAEASSPHPGLHRLDRRAGVAILSSSASGSGANSAAGSAAADSDDDSDDPAPARPKAHPHRRGDNDRVSVLGSVEVEAGKTLRGDAVAVLGSLTVDGTVEGDAVAVLGASTINGTVKGQAVAVLGDLTLGPTARIRGDAVCVAGHLYRAPGAIVEGEVVQQGLGGVHAGLPMTAWWSQGLSHGRVLAVGRHLTWLWVVNIVLIAFYALLALVFPGGIRRCGETLRRRPGIVVLAAFLTLLALPLVFVLLCVTIIGIPVALLFLPLAILVATLFGRAAIYGLVGRAITGSRLNASLTVMVGAIFFIFLYLLPGFGLALWLAVGFIGLGVVVATLFGPKPIPPAVPVTPSGTPPPGVPVGAGAASSVPDSAGAGTPSASGWAGAGPAVATPTSVPPLMADAVLPETNPIGASLRSPPPPAAGMPGPSALTHPRAGFWIRSAALAIDLILVAVIFFWCLAPLLHGFFGNRAPGPFLPVLAIYGAILWKMRGSTVGGIIFGLKVVRLDDRPIDWGTAVVRALACFLSLIVVGLGFIWVAFDPDKQSWHDKIAGTTVVRAPKEVSLV